jgi:hypothetical protein
MTDFTAFKNVLSQARAIKYIMEKINSYLCNQLVNASFYVTSRMFTEGEFPQNRTCNTRCHFLTCFIQKISNFDKKLSTTITIDNTCK